MRLSINIPAGVNSDDTPKAYPGTWLDADKVRFWRDKPQVIGGWESATGDVLSGVCRTVWPWTDNDAQSIVAFGQHNALSVLVGGVVYAITPSSGFTAGQIDGTGGSGYGTGTYGTGNYSSPSSADYFPLTWSFGNYGQSLMANPRGQGIFWWQNSTGTPAATLTNAPARVTCVLTTQTRQVMALGCNEEVSGTFNPLCIRFSDVEAPTTWATATNNLAGEVILEGGGVIVGAVNVADSVFVWTNSALFVGRFTGNETQPWVFDQVGSGCGLAGPNARAILAQSAFWFSSNGRFFTCPLGGAPSLIELSVGDEMANNLASSQNDKIVGSAISPFNEVWWFYADARDGNEVSRYVSISIPSGQASKGTLARTAFCDAGPATTKYPLGVTYSGAIYYHEKGTSADGGAFSAFIQSAYFYMTDEEKLMLVRGFWPDFKGQQGAISLTLETGLYPQSALTTLGPFIVSAGDEKYDFMATGRMVKITFTSNSSPNSWRMGSPTFDVVSAGDR